MLSGSPWMSLLVATLMYTSLFQQNIKVWGRRPWGGRGDLGPPACLFVIFMSGHGLWVPWGYYEKSLELGILGEGVLFIFSLFGDSQLWIYLSASTCCVDLLFPFLRMMQNVWVTKNMGLYFLYFLLLSIRKLLEQTTYLPFILIISCFD